MGATDPLTLHFNVFAVGENNEAKRSIQVADPRSTTVGTLKRQLFGEELQAGKSVRFITAGKMLQDPLPLEKCGLGKEACIHVSISQNSTASLSPCSSPAAEPTREVSSQSLPSVDLPPTSPASRASTPVASSFAPYDSNSLECAVETSRLDNSFKGLLVGALLFAASACMFRVAWEKRWGMSMHISQMCCIAGVTWVYLFLCHWIPALFSAIGRCLSTSRARARSAMAKTSHMNIDGGVTVTNSTDGSIERTAGAATAVMAPAISPPGDLRHRAAGVPTGVL